MMNRIILLILNLYFKFTLIIIYYTYIILCYYNQFSLNLKSNICNIGTTHLDNH